MSVKASTPECESSMCEKMDRYFGAKPFRVSTKEEFAKDGSLKSSTPVTVPCVFPTFEGFAAKIGVTLEVLEAWEKEDSDFAAACGRARCRQTDILIANVLAGLYNLPFSQFMLKRISPDRFGGESVERDALIRVEYAGQ